jgi:hypothetical protein
MKIRLLVAFVRWIFSKIVSNVADANSEFRRSLRLEPVLALFAWLILTVIFMTVITVIGAIFIDSPAQLGWFVLAQFTVSVLYLLTNSITIMYEAFKRDRHELFNILKDPR